MRDTIPFQTVPAWNPASLPTDLLPASIASYIHRQLWCHHLCGCVLKFYNFITQIVSANLSLDRMSWKEFGPFILFPQNFFRNENILKYPQNYFPWGMNFVCSPQNCKFCSIMKIQHSISIVYICTSHECEKKISCASVTIQSHLQRDDQLEFLSYLSFAMFCKAQHPMSQDYEICQLWTIGSSNFSNCWQTRNVMFVQLEALFSEGNHWTPLDIPITTP